MYPDYLKYLLHQIFSAFLEILKRHLCKKENKYMSFYYTAENNRLLDTLKSIAKRTFFKRTIISL